MMGPCEKDTGSGLKGVPQAKFGTIWAKTVTELYYKALS